MRWAFGVVLAACGSAPAVPDTRLDAGYSDAPADAAFDTDGCPVGLYAATLEIADGDMAFTPTLVEVPETQYVRLVTSATHDMHFTTASDSAGTPPAPVGFATRTCRRFGLPDAPFHLIVTCSVHGESAEIIVQPVI